MNSERSMTGSLVRTNPNNSFRHNAWGIVAGFKYNEWEEMSLIVFWSDGKTEVVWPHRVYVEII